MKKEMKEESRMRKDEQVLQMEEEPAIFVVAACSGTVTYKLRALRHQAKAAPLRLVARVP